MTNSCEEAKRGCAGPGGLSPPPAASTSTWRLLQKGAGGKGRLRAALSRDRRTSEGSNSSNRCTPAPAGTEIGWQVPQISIRRDEAEPGALHGRLRADRKGLGPCHEPTPGAEAFQRLVSSAAHPSRWLRPAPAAPGGLSMPRPSGHLRWVQIQQPRLCKSWGASRGRGQWQTPAPRHAGCPQPSRPQALLSNHHSYCRSSQLRQQPPVKLRVVKLCVNLAPRMPHQPPRSTWGCLNSLARAAKGCFGWSWSREKQAPCILSKQLGKDTGTVLGLERWRALL